MTFVILMIIVMLSVSCTEKESITVSKSSLEWTMHGGRKTVDVTANCSWTITTPEWVTVEPSSGTGNSNIVIRAAKNDDVQRSGTLIIASGDAMAEIARRDGMVGVDFDGIRYDMGNKFGILKANIEVGLKHPEVKDELKDFIKKIAAEI